MTAIKEFFSGLVAKVKAFFAGIVAWVKGLFGKKSDETTPSE